MRKWMSAVMAISVVFTVFTVVGCDSNGDQLSFRRVSDVPADPVTGHDPNTGAPIGATGRYTFFNLRTNEIVLDRDNDDRSDSVGTGWDIAFQSTNIIVNSAATGGGQGGVQVVDADIGDVTEAPSSGYSTQTVGLEGGQGPAWGLYNAQSMLVFPLEGTTLVIKTADGKYAKLRIISYYEGAPEVPTISDASRYYTFEYLYQPDGSRNISAD